MRIVAALGGNALLRRDQAMTARAQHDNVRQAARAVAALAEDNDLVVTHGNGPQVGILALQAAALDRHNDWPLDVLDAESEGMIGYLIERELASRLPHRRFATLLTQVVVDPDDPAFARPTKPIGPRYGEAEARHAEAERGWHMAPDGPGWRRVVPSPRPRGILEITTIRHLLADGVVVICAGGGGIPVTMDETGVIRGVEAVVDKDRTSALLAAEVGAEMLLLLTDVAGVYRDFGTETAALLADATSEELAALALDPGSMGPKVEAAAEFVTRTGAVAAIGCLEDAAEIAAGRAGTRIRQARRA